MNQLRVVVLKEPAGEGRYVWVAVALEVFMATQVGVGDGPLDAVEALGMMFDADDAFERTVIGATGADRKDVARVGPPPAPDEYVELFNEGTPLGDHPLGAARRAEVRQALWTGIHSQL
jgi:hypothetical protein